MVDAKSQFFKKSQVLDFLYRSSFNVASLILCLLAPHDSFYPGVPINAWTWCNRMCSNPFKCPRYPGETKKLILNGHFPLDTNVLGITQKISGNYFKFCLKMGKVKIYVKIFNRPRSSNVILMMSWYLDVTSKRNSTEGRFQQDPIQVWPFIEATLGTGWRGAENRGSDPN